MPAMASPWVPVPSLRGGQLSPDDALTPQLERWMALMGTLEHTDDALTPQLERRMALMGTLGDTDGALTPELERGIAPGSTG